MNPERKDLHLNAKSHSGVIITDDQNRVLYVKSSEKGRENTWSLPAGHLEFGEIPQQTAVRKAKEETGLDIELVGLVGVYIGPKAEGYTGIGSVFAAKVIGETLEPSVIDHKSECRYFTLKQIEVMNLSGLIYRPEYNFVATNDYFSGTLYPTEVIKLVNSLK